MIIPKSLAEFIPSQAERFFASLRMTGGRAQNDKAKGSLFLLQKEIRLIMFILSKIERRVWLNCQ